MSVKTPKQHLGAYIGPAPTDKQLKITLLSGTERTVFCDDLRHGTPCPLPCRACEEECS